MTDPTFKVAYENGDEITGVLSFRGYKRLDSDDTLTFTLDVSDSYNLDLVANGLLGARIELLVTSEDPDFVWFAGDIREANPQGATRIECVAHGNTFVLDNLETTQTSLIYGPRGITGLADDILTDSGASFGSYNTFNAVLIVPGSSASNSVETNINAWATDVDTTYGVATNVNTNNTSEIRADESGDLISSMYIEMTGTYSGDPSAVVAVLPRIKFAIFADGASGSVAIQMQCMEAGGATYSSGEWVTVKTVSVPSFEFLGAWIPYDETLTIPTTLSGDAEYFFKDSDSSYKVRIVRSLDSGTRYLKAAVQYLELTVYTDQSYDGSHFVVESNTGTTITATTSFTDAGVDSGDTYVVGYRDDQLLSDVFDDHDVGDRRFLYSIGYGVAYSAKSFDKQTLRQVLKYMCEKNRSHWVYSANINTLYILTEAVIASGSLGSTTNYTTSNCYIRESQTKSTQRVKQVIVTGASYPRLGDNEEVVVTAQSPTSGFDGAKILRINDTSIYSWTEAYNLAVNIFNTKNNTDPTFVINPLAFDATILPGFACQITAGDTYETVVKAVALSWDAAGNWTQQLELGYQDTPLWLREVMRINEIADEIRKINQELARRPAAAGGGSIDAGDRYILDHAVLDTGNETIAGVKTFTSFPVSPSSSPTTDYQFANKLYVDTTVAAITLDEINNPDTDVSFTMANKNIEFLFTTGGGGDGVFTIEATGNFSGDLLHVHQHTGSPVSAVNLAHFHATSANVNPAQFTAEATKPPFKVNTTVKVDNLNADLLDGYSSSAFTQLAYSAITDGSTSAIPASPTDTFKIRSSDGSVGVDVTNNDVTHGDNVDLTINQASLLSNFYTEAEVDALLDAQVHSASDITTGTLAVARGGTGQSSYAKGDILAGNATTTLSTLTVGSNGKHLVANSAQATGLEWQDLSVDLTSDVTGLLPIARGGNNNATFTVSELLKYDGSAIVSSGFEVGDFASASHNHDSLYPRLTTAESITGIYTFSNSAIPKQSGTGSQLDPSEDANYVTRYYVYNTYALKTMVAQGSASATWRTPQLTSAGSYTGFDIYTTGFIPSANGANIAAFMLTIPTSLGGLSLYISRIEFYLSDADSNNKITSVTVRGLNDSAGSGTLLLNDTTGWSSIGKVTLNPTDIDCSSYDNIHIWLIGTTTTNVDLEISYVKYEYYYA